MHFSQTSITSGGSGGDSKRDMYDDRVFRWESLQSFMFLSGTFASTNINFDLFSGALSAVPIFMFVFCELFIGMPYMCMDFFIKMYTGKIDLNETLNPILKAVNYVIIITATCWCVIHANDLSDAVIYLCQSLQTVPKYSECNKDSNIKICLPAKNISILCDATSKSRILLNQTSIHIFYTRYYVDIDKSNQATRILVIGLVWLLNFFFSTVSDSMCLRVIGSVQRLKINLDFWDCDCENRHQYLFFNDFKKRRISIPYLFKLFFIFRSCTTIIILCYIFWYKQSFTLKALKDMVGSTEMDLYSCVTSVTYAYGVGLVGVYDFGTMSPYTFVDNAVILFTATFTILAILRSLIAKTLTYVLKDCINVPKLVGSHHYFLMTVLPLSAHLMKAPKILLYYFFTNTIFTLCPHIAAITFTISKLLHSEFHALKNVYLSGIICFVGFGASASVTSRLHQDWQGINSGLNVTMLLLACLKVSVIMYIYGVKRFAADVHFWLGFKPTIYWIFSWSILPVVLLILFIKYFVLHATREDNAHSDLERLIAQVWVYISIVLLMIFLLRIIFKYAAQSKLMAIIIASNKYGAPDSDERKKRKRYSEETTIRQCNHECFFVDDRFDCTHVPNISKHRKSSDTSIQSLLNPYEQERLSTVSTVSSRFSRMSTVSEKSTMIDVNVD